MNESGFTCRSVRISLPCTYKERKGYSNELVVGIIFRLENGANNFFKNINFKSRRNIEVAQSHAWHATFNIQHPIAKFNIQHSTATFNIQHSTFNIQHSTFNTQRTECRLEARKASTSSTDCSRLSASTLNVPPFANISDVRNALSVEHSCITHQWQYRQYRQVLMTHTHTHTK